MIKLLAKQVIYPAIRSKPDFLIVGVQRAGITSLYRYLSQHPQILVIQSLKETYYFNVTENYSKGLGWYLGHFPLKVQKGNRLTFEACPSYLYDKQVPKRIKQDLGSIRAIAVLREPTSRAYSAWQMFHSYSMLPHKHLRDRADNRTFFEAISEELSSMGNEVGNATNYPYEYLNRGKYASQLKNYFEYFSRDRLLILSFDEFCRDLSATLNQICDFLQIDRFSPNAIAQFRQEKHAMATYIKNVDDEKALALLKEYFVPFNEDLYNLLEYRYGW